MSSGNFNKELFSKLLQLAQGDKKERSLNQYGHNCDVDPGLISRYINMKSENPPTAKTIQKLASKAKNGITYSDLMKSAGYLDPEDEDCVDSYIIHNLLLVMENKSPEEFVAIINDPRISKDMIEHYLSGSLVPQAGTLFILAERLSIDYNFFYKNNTWTDYTNAKEDYIQSIAIDNTGPVTQTLSQEEWLIINTIRSHNLDLSHVKNILDILIAQK